MTDPTAATYDRARAELGPWASDDQITRRALGLMRAQVPDAAEASIIAQCELLLHMGAAFERVFSPDPPCRYCTPDARCWFHRPFIHGSK